MITEITSDEQWHQLRAAHIGASEVGALANVSPWATAYSLYQVKKGNAEPPPVSDDVENGRDFEQAIAARYAADNGLNLEKVRHYHTCDTLPFLGATLDYKFSSFEGKPIATEIKHVRTQSWRHHGWSPEEDYMPPHIEMQIVAQMMCTGWDEGRVVAFCDGEYYSFTRRRGDTKVEHIAGVIGTLVIDMELRLKKGYEPDAFGKPIELAMMGIAVPTDKEKSVLDLTHDNDADQAVHELAWWQSNESQSKKMVDQLKVKITQLMARNSNDGSVAPELLTAHYRLKRTQSPVAAKTVVTKAYIMTRFTANKREDAAGTLTDPVNPIAAG